MAEDATLTPRARFFLRSGLVVAWLTGIGGAVGSCRTLSAYQAPRPIAAEAASARPATSGSAIHPSASVSGVASASVEAPSASSSASALAPAAAPSPSATASVAVSPSAAAPVAPTLVLTSEQLRDRNNEIFVTALEHQRRTHLPLTVANLLLSMLLAAAVARVLSRRAGARAIAQQALMANALLVAIGYLLERGFRSELIGQLADLTAVAQSPAPTADELRAIVAGMQLLWLIGVCLEAAFFAGLAYWLGRPAVAFELAPRADDPDSRGDEGSDE
jgi:hypothetical protein